MTAAIRFGVLVGSLLLAPMASACGSSEEFDPDALQSKVWLIDACAYRYVNGWEIAYLDYCLDKLNHPKFTDDLPMPFLGGRYAFTRQAWQDRGIQQAEIALELASLRFGSDRLMLTTTAAWYLIGGRDDEMLTDMIWR